MGRRGSPRRGDAPRSSPGDDGGIKMEDIPEEDAGTKDSDGWGDNLCGRGKDCLEFEDFGFNAFHGGGEGEGNRKVNDSDGNLEERAEPDDSSPAPERVQPPAATEAPLRPLLRRRGNSSPRDTRYGSSPRSRRPMTQQQQRDAARKHPRQQPQDIIYDLNRLDDALDGLPFREGVSNSTGFDSQ